MSIIMPTAICSRVDNYYRRITNRSSTKANIDFDFRRATGTGDRIADLAIFQLVAVLIVNYKFKA